MSVGVAQTVARLRRFIVEGQLTPGVALREADVAAMLGVGWTAVHGALRELWAQGLVEMLPDRVMRVAEWTHTDLDEIFELRTALECRAAARAARRIEPTALHGLEDLCAEMEVAAHTTGSAALLRLAELDMRFHGAIGQAGGGPRLATMLECVLHPDLIRRTIAHCDVGERRRILRQHRELVDALRAGSADWACAVMGSHVLAERVAAMRAVPPARARTGAEAESPRPALAVMVSARARSA